MKLFDSVVALGEPEKVETPREGDADGIFSAETDSFPPPLLGKVSVKLVEGDCERSI